MSRVVAALVSRWTARKTRRRCTCAVYGGSCPAHGTGTSPGIEE